MKHMRKALSLLLVLAMVVCFAVPAFAADTDTATVTVYVTTGMFTEGGIDDNGDNIAQTYIGGNPESYLIPNYVVIPVDSLSISASLSDCRDVYNAPNTLSNNVNVLDAIIYSLMFNGYTCRGGWDTVNIPNGGYVHDVLPGYAGTVAVTYPTINGVQYERYTGSGWNIAFTQNGQYVVPELYGNNFVIEDGMEIVFDYSPYVQYAPVTASN